MSDLIDREAFIEQERKVYCEDCDRRKGMKNGKLTFCYEIGEAPCRACWCDDVLTDLEDFPAAPRWVRCEEPPKTTQDLWLHDEHGHYHVGCVSTYHGYTEFIDMDGNTLHGIEYWMPIEPPKEGE